MSDVGLAVWTVVCMVVGGMFTLIFLMVAQNLRGDDDDKGTDEPAPWPPDEYVRLEWEREDAKS